MYIWERCYNIVLGISAATELDELFPCFRNRSRIPFASECPLDSLRSALLLEDELSVLFDKALRGLGSLGLFPKFITAVSTSLGGVMAGCEFSLDRDCMNLIGLRSSSA
jgi:hypothetical protein